MKIPITSDPDVLERIYRRFSYLRDHPLNLLGSFIDEAESLGVLESEDFLCFVMAYEVEEESPSSNRHHFLTPEENRMLRFYRHLRPVEPWPQPIIGVVWDAARGEGRVSGTHRVDVVMKSIGNAQMWWGGEVAVLWEAFFDERVRHRDDHELFLHQLWEQCEAYLAEQGVKRVYTLGRDPVFDDAFYRAFLVARGYEPLGNALVKQVV
jgi:hypothetical protein